MTEMMKKYRTHKWNDKIEEIEVLRETENSVWLKSTGRRVARETDYEQIHDTWEQALQFIFDRTQKTLDRLREDVIKYSGKLAAISAMKKP